MSEEASVVTGYFDHSNGVYRLTLEIPIKTIMTLNPAMGQSTAQNMLWVAELIYDEALKLRELEIKNEKMAEMHAALTHKENRNGYCNRYVSYVLRNR